MSAMTEPQLVALLQAHEAESAGFHGDQVAAEQDRALDYYYGRAFGDEVEGRSSVVSRDVAEVVDWLLPDLMRIFVGSRQVVRFEPFGAEDEAIAGQATDYVNHVFWRDNDGFRLMHDWFKDALLQKVGVVKVWWDDAERVTRTRYVGQSAAALAVFRADPEAALEDVRVSADDGDLYDFVVRRRLGRGRVRVAAVPAEEFLVPPRTRSLAEAAYVAHRSRRPRADLIAMGLPEALVARLDHDGPDWRFARDRFQDEAALPSDDQVTVLEEFVRADVDGDGIAELRHVIRVGATVLQNQEVDEHPFATLCPVPMPHRFYGQSVADQVMDLQRIKSVLWRQMLDNFYLTNNARVAVDTTGDHVNLDDLLTSRPGGIVRTQGNPQGKILPLNTPGLSQQSFQMVEYIDGVKEARSGITRFAQGLDADALNHTATGVREIMEAARGRKELIARIFAETGVRDLFRKMLRLVVRYQDRARTVRLRGEWVEIDPRHWNADMDVTVSVGIGTGSRDQTLAHLAGIAAKQEAMLQLLGPSNPLVSLKNLHNTYSRIVENAGLRAPDEYFSDPDQAPPPAAPPPDPHGMAFHADLERKAREAAEKIALEREKALGDLALQREKLAHDFALRAEELRLKYGLPALEVGGADIGVAPPVDTSMATDKPNGTGGQG
ncbi:MAG: hypothetical protein RIM84_26160 [Alphaproteobacteria bacterium]